MKRFIDIFGPSRCFVFFIFTFISISGMTRAQEVTGIDTTTKAFYDTLKVRAEKTRITRLLYDIVVVTPPSGNLIREKLGSTKPYGQYEGMIIRRCEIIRLNAFGTNINDPQVNNPTPVEKVLNSTYIKTHTFVLRKYLLFEQGDTISSLQLSDNERLLRELPFVEDVRIEVIPSADNLADVVVIIRETYPVGFDVMLNDISSGRLTLFTRNFGGLGHELDIALPYKFEEYPYPAIGIKYAVKNIAHSFSNLILDFSDGLGSTSAGGTFHRPFVSSDTKYAWSASMRMTSTMEDLDTMEVPSPLKFISQDYWASRSFMLNRDKVTRLIISARYLNQNVYNRPEIDDNSYYRLQKYQLYLGSIALSTQKFINTSLIYSYGRTENIPYGYLFEAVAGRENNEFKLRDYVGFRISYGNVFDGLGYVYGGVAFSTFFNKTRTEQGVFQASLRYFTPLIHAGGSQVRTFLNLYYIRGFNRYSDENLYLKSTNLIRGFRNDSLYGNHRVVLNFEPVLFTPKPVYGFRFALFTFADAGIIIKGDIEHGKYRNVVGFGFGVRVRNDQLVLNTIQIRFGIYPGAPPYSETSWASVSGLVKYRPPGFEPEPPGVVPYR